MSAKNKSKSELNALFAVMREGSENSYYYSMTENKAVVAAFGGVGDDIHPSLSGKTSGFIASKAVCGGVKSWFEDSLQGDIKDYISRALSVCQKKSGNAGFGASMAMAICEEAERLNVKCLWAGEASCFMLNCDGLHLLTEGSGDVMGCDKDYTISEKSFLLDTPCVVVTAAKGVPSEFDSPYEFEYLLLDTMRRVNGTDEWAELMIKETEGTPDDITMSIAIYGGDSFQSVRKYFSERRDYIYRAFIEKSDSSEEKHTQYKENYNKYI